MNKWTKLIGSFILAATATLAGCDGDDSVDDKDGGASSSSSSGAPDAKVSTDASDDGGGTCDFAGFVTNLITTQTNATSVPSTNLGESCTDKRDPAQFAALFP